MRTLALLRALLLAACGSIGFSDMPNPRDDAALRRALLSLDPVAPGGVRTREGNYGLGQRNSDREVFADWVRHYLAADDARLGNIDYKPIPLPGSIGEAIEGQRAFRREEQRSLDLARQQAAAEQAAQAERDRERAVEERAMELERERQVAIADKVQAMGDSQSALRDKAYAACSHQVSIETFKNSASDDGSVSRAFDCKGKRDAQAARDQQKLEAFQRSLTGPRETQHSQ